MEPTFYSGQYIFTSKVTYKFRAIHRGDVVVIHSPKNYEVEYIKRVMGLPGDKIVFQDSELYINDIKISEPYISASTPLWDGGFTREGEPYIVPEGKIYILGDNRPKSADSREFGTVPISTVIGQVFYRYYPATKVGPIKNPLPTTLQNK